MKVPLLDLGAQLEPLRSEILKAIENVVDSGRFIMGPEIETLETEIAEYLGVDGAVGVSSGTDALLIALMALDLKPGDLVIVPTYSFFATAGVVSRLNAEPVFIDIDEQSYNICPVKLREWFDSSSSERIAKVKAIMPVHLYGQCAPMKEIMALSEQYGIPVIEDAAQAIGSTYPMDSGMKKAGAIGHMGCFSFFPSKNLGAIGDGGMVTTNDPALLEKLRMLRNHGAKPKYYHSLIGGNFRLDTIQAAVLRVKLPHLEAWHKARRDNAAYYDNNLKVDGILKPKCFFGRDAHIYNQYVITVPRDRDGLREYLTEKNIGCEVYYPVPFHLQQCFEYLGYKEGALPTAEHAATHSLAIPVFPEITSEMQDYVIETIGAFYGK